MKRSPADARCIETGFLPQPGWGAKTHFMQKAMYTRIFTCSNSRPVWWWAWIDVRSDLCRGWARNGARIGGCWPPSTRWPTATGFSQISLWLLKRQGFWWYGWVDLTELHLPTSKSRHWARFSPRKLTKKVLDGAAMLMTSLGGKQPLWATVTTEW